MQNHSGEIMKYLGDRHSKGTNVYGKCKTCRKDVAWNWAKVSSHKRANCIGISDEDKAKFRGSSIVASADFPTSTGSKRVRTNDDEDILLKRWVDTVSQEEKQAYDKLLAAFVYRTGIPYRVVSSDSFREFINAVRPAYAKVMADEKKLRTTLLETTYDDLALCGKKFIDESPCYSLATDGWSNIKGQHLVNYVVLTPGNKPFYYKSIDTSSTPQTSEEVSSSILQVINELGPAKCVSVLTDNCSVMQRSWTLIESQKQTVFTNGCSGHALNLLIGDILKIPLFKSTIDNGKVLVNSIKKRHFVLHRYNILRNRFDVSCGLVTHCPTRWYTNFNMLQSLLNSRFIITQKLVKDPEVIAVFQGNEFLSIANNEQFWIDAEKLSNILSHPTALIGKLESDKSHIGMVYSSFRNLQRTFEQESEYREQLLESLDYRWNFLHTECMGFAYLLTPKFHLGDEMVGNDKVDSVRRLKTYFNRFFTLENGLVDQEKVTESTGELNTYLSYFNLLPESTKNEYFSLHPLQFWNTYGCKMFPTLYKVAWRLFSIPCTSCASERVWSVLGFLQSKTRNRMLSENLDKLGFIYINSSLLDQKDSTDYFAEVLDNEPE